MRNASRLTVTAVVLSLAVAGCGGGSGDGGPAAAPATPKAPPGPNQKPVLAIALSTERVEEGTALTVDLSGSTDDGSIVRYDLREPEDSGAYWRVYEEDIAHDGAGVFRVTAPDVIESPTGNGVALWAEVEDDRGAVAGGWVEFGVIDVVDADKADAIKTFRRWDGTPSLEFLAVEPFNSDTILAIDHDDPFPDGSDRIVVVGDVYRAAFDFSFVGNAEVRSGVRDLSALFPGALTFNLSPGSGQQFLTASEKTDRLQWFVDYEQGNPIVYVEDQVILLADPCDVRGRTDTGQDFAVVGQRGAGLSVVGIDPIRPTGFSHRGFDWNLVSTAGGERSLCTIFPTDLPSQYSKPFAISALDDLIAIDHDANELVFFADDQEPALVYEEVGALPIETNGAEGLRIVDVVTSGTPSLVPNTVWILMSDGRDGGEHRVVVVDNRDDQITQEVLAYEGSAPDRLFVMGLFGNEGRGLDVSADVVVLSLRAGEGWVFEDEQIEVSDVLFDHPVYRDPERFSFEPGAGSAVMVGFPGVNSALTPGAGLLLAYPDSGQVRYVAYLR